ncbi:TetR/AcrR family transcriptional regulator [Kytococcus schroeteri]|uniref:TetR/AcrR family transcriptional regulator n=1 Tax=Kytococcus schroeteri TaxID=138300 RepID=UPI00114468F7|nr:TetR/AcrR family transcriptional regulator [Kytococcus schroeteri]
MPEASDLDRLLDAAEALYYERGFHAVGMDALRAASGLPLKRIYALLPGKEAIAVAMLDRRDDAWHRALAARVQAEEGGVARVLAVFDWLEGWLARDGYRGCAWINAFGEMGGTSPEVAAAVRRRKERLRSCLEELVAEAGHGPAVADGVFLLVEGCMVTAGITGDPGAARGARSAASLLLEAPPA